MDINICIVHPNKDAYSETFIRAHIEKLPGNIKVLYGGWLPEFKDNDKPIVPLLFMAIDMFLERFCRLSYPFFRTMSISNYFENNKINVVLAEYGPTGVAMMDICKKNRIPLIVHFHGFDASYKPTLEEYKAKYQKMFEYASGIISVSNMMTDQLIRLGAPKNKIHCIPCGADTDLFQSSDPSSAKVVFVAVGRFTDKKAPHLTILAFKKVLEVVPDAKLVMAGTGELYEACNALVNALKIKQSVDFIGTCSHQDVVKLMQSARAFVQHSITTMDGDSEGTPVAVMEASAIGLPVIGTKHAGIMDVIVHGETGFLVDEFDVDTMAEYMIEIARKPVLAKQFGERGKKRIRDNYSLGISLSKLSKVVMAVI